jgi:hypothetical protein
MTAAICLVCQKPKANLSCGLCHSAVCKSCAQFLNEDDFAFLPEAERKFANGTYCTPCFDSEIGRELAAYDELRERAGDVTVYFKNQSKETRLFKRSKDILSVPSCADREETVLRLAFLAAQKGYNAIIDVDISAEKVRSKGGYQTSNWRGTAVATNLEGNKPPPPERGSPN